VKDPRVGNLAQILVRYSTRVGEGDTCVIEGPTAAEPLIAAVYEEVLAAGGHPIVAMAFEGQPAAYFSGASDAQLEWVSPLADWAAEEADCRIAIGADTNTRQLSQVDPARQTKRQAATRHLMEATMKRAAEGAHRWVYTLYPTNGYASDAEMSLADFEDFYFGACLATDGDPLGAWKRASEECERLAAWMGGRSEVHVTAQGTDIKLGIEGRTIIPCTGEHNMPDGEFFTGPIEDSVEGEVTFHLPAVIGGREVTGVRLRFEAGKVIDASAERNED
jgi:aminopeptidase